VEGRTLSRRDLDAALLGEALAAGAQFQDQVVAQAGLVDDARRGPLVRGAALRTGRGTVMRVPACVTIAADGRHSTLAFTLGLARHPDPGDGRSGRTSRACRT
jgi:flavin-dependent dehydrogenase